MSYRKIEFAPFLASDACNYTLRRFAVCHAKNRVK